VVPEKTEDILITSLLFWFFPVFLRLSPGNQLVSS
jgi:hypothetical protein